MNKKLSDQPKNDFNPFVKNLELTTYQKPVLPKKNEINGSIPEFIEYKKVDKERFVKIFTNRMRIFYQLSIGEKDLLYYIIENLKAHSDLIYLSPKEIRERTGISTNATISKAINTLINHNIIAKSSVPRGYFINPAIIFSGDRVKFVEVFSVGTEEKKVEIKQENEVIIPQDSRDY